MKDEDKTKAELIKELETLRKEREKGVFKDITDYKKAEEKLEQSEKRYRSISKLSSDYFYSLKVESSGQMDIEWISEAFERATTYHPDEIKNFTKWMSHIHPDDIPGLRKNTKTLLANNFVISEYRLFTKNRETRWFSDRLQPEWDGEQERVSRVYGAVRDVTKRKLVEENIKKIKDELQMILDLVPAIIFYKDIEGRVIRANKASADSLKMPVKDMLGKTVEELFPREQAEKMRKDDQEVMISGKPKRNIIQPCTTPDGTRWVIIDKIPYKGKEGKIAGVIGLAKDITIRIKAEERLKKTTDAAIDTMSKIIEAKDPYTSGHQRRVCQLAVPLAQELGLSQDKIEGVRVASLIHDIGKVGLPAEILSKPIKLTEIEFSLIKNHAQIGYDILKFIDFPYPVAKIVLQHHERLNGSGYPNSLKGDEILLEAKIIGVADVVEAMSSHRPYRPALGTDEALEEISKNKGILYDSEVVDVCLKLFKEKGFKFR